MKIVGEVIIAGGGLRTDFESASRIKIALPLLGITGSFGLKPMCNDAPKQRERMWRAFVATDCYQLRNKGSAQPRFSKGPRAVIPCSLERPSVKRCVHVDAGLFRNLAAKSRFVFVKLVAKRKMKIRIYNVGR